MLYNVETPNDLTEIVEALETDLVDYEIRIIAIGDLTKNMN